MENDSILAALGITADDLAPPPPGVVDNALHYAFTSNDQVDDSTVPIMDDEPVVPDSDFDDAVITDSVDADDHNHEEHTITGPDGPHHDSIVGDDPPTDSDHELHIDLGNHDDPHSDHDDGPDLHL